MRIVIYGQPNDNTAFSSIGQIRSICVQLRVEANVMIVTDPQMHAANGVSALPAIEVEGNIISMGYMPSRMEIERAIRQKAGQLSKK
jgi:hypothetical protein